MKVILERKLSLCSNNVFSPEYTTLRKEIELVSFVKETDLKSCELIIGSLIFLVEGEVEVMYKKIIYSEKHSPALLVGVLPSKDIHCNFYTGNSYTIRKEYEQVIQLLLDAGWFKGNSLPIKEMI